MPAISVQFIYCSTNLPNLLHSSHKFLKIPLPDPSNAAIHISLSYVPKTPNKVYTPGAKAFCTPSSITNSGYSANKATYSIINHGICFDTAFPVFAAFDVNFWRFDSERQNVEGGSAHIVRMREKSLAEGTVQGETSHGGGRERVVRRGRGARGVVRMKRWRIVWRR